VQKPFVLSEIDEARTARETELGGARDETSEVRPTLSQFHDLIHLYNSLQKHRYRRRLLRLYYWSG
jgi:hypothetical protein